MSREIAIEIKNLSKSFRLPTEQASGLKQAVVNRFKGIKGYKEQKVLRDISFNVEKGDFFGIVGRNGSGKSTLLKLISGIYEPGGGSIKINGSLVAFIELGVGFNPQLTGRENVYLNGALMGFDVKQIDAMYDEIVEFAELGEFMDQKLKNYSSGMQVRLAFSCAIRAKSDILVLDEVLAVGDEAFQRKCNGYFAKLRRDKKTVILVTHNMDVVQQFCNRAIMLENGKIMHAGETSKVAQAYRELFMGDTEKAVKKNEQITNEFISAKINHTSVNDKLKFNIEIVSKTDVMDAVIVFIIHRDNGEWVYRWTSDEKLERVINLKKNSKIELVIEIDNIFPDGVFDVELGVKKHDRTMNYAAFSSICVFEIIHHSLWSGDVLWKPKEKYEIK